MPTTTDSVTIIHISDTHIGPADDYARHGQVSLPSAANVIGAINALPAKPDAIVHTGDIVTDPDPRSYRRAAKHFEAFDVPIYYVVGNHDRAVDIESHLPMGPRERLCDDPALLTYAFEIRGHRFLIVDARAPDQMDPHGLVGERQMEIIRREATPDGPPLTVFIHFPIWPMNALWFDRNMLVLNGEEFHAALLPARPRLRGVFHGHVHMPMQTYRDGIMYGAAASTFCNFAAWPDVADVEVSPYPPAFNRLVLLPNQTLVYQHVVGGST